GSSRVIAGHGRLQAAQLLGLTELPTICIEHLSEEQAKAFAIADNKLTENSTWNRDLLGEQLKALSEAELDFDVEAIGFEMAEIDLLIEGLSPATETHVDPADEVPASADQAVSRPNDLWLLGNHRLFCGDSRDVKSYSLLMDGGKAD